MEEPKLLHETEKASLYLADSLRDYKVPGATKPVIAMEVRDSFEGKIPETIDEAIDLMLEKYDSSHGTLSLARLNDDKYKHIKLLRQEAVKSIDKPFVEGDLNLFVREAAHCWPQGHPLMMESYPRNLNSMRVSSREEDIVFYIGNTPKQIKKAFIECGLLEYFSEHFLASARLFNDMIHEYPVDLKNISSCDELKNHARDTTIGRQEKFDWCGLDTLFPDEAERLERIKEYQRNWFPGEISRVVKADEEFREWLKTLKD